MKHFRTLLAALGVAAATGAAPALAQDEKVMVVFDGSNSMWGQIEGTAKVEIARGVMDNLLGSWTDNREVGLMAYGHRNRGDCTDIETIVAPGQGTREEILERVRDITPTGKTPLTSAVEAAARELSYTDAPATVVLISDGLESCDRDPCALAESLEKSGVGFTAHVVGFGLGDTDAAALSCIADNTGGQFMSAANADELGAALSQVATAVAAPEPEPEPEPEPVYDVTLTAPETAETGSVFEVSWTGTVSGSDYITIVPMGSDEGTRDNHFRVRDKDRDNLRAPGDAGMYEVRYVLDEDGSTLASQPIEVTEPSVTVSAPESTLAGSVFEVTWTGTVSGSDYVTIVPMGSDEGTRDNHFRVRDKERDNLRAPSETGMYEVRYVLDEGDRTLASQPIEVTEPEVTVSAPESALAGSVFEVTWTGTVSGSDYVTIVPMGSDEGTRDNHFRVRDKERDNLRAPSETGMYEVRYVLDEGDRTMAAQPIEVTEPEVSVTAPATALAGSAFEVTWTGTVSGSDYVTIVPMGSDDGTRNNHFRVRDKERDNLRAPSETGMYEVRYVLDEGDRTMASQPIEVTEPEVTVSAPAQVRIGDPIPVTWTGTVSGNDYVTIVPLGTAEGTRETHFRVRDKQEDTLSAPSQTGLYELRYVLDEGDRTLARTQVEVLAEDAALQSGATLEAPERAAAGSTVEIGWSVAERSADQRITIARADQAIFTWASAVKIEGEGPVSLTLPDDPGAYEIRFLDLTAQDVLARKTIAVE
ncbi:MAG: VWA domain-containing protein [Maritimibacter harenae]